MVDEQARPPRWPVAEPRLPADREPTDLDALADDERLDEVALGPGTGGGVAVDGLTIVRSTLTGVRLTGATFRRLALVDVVVDDCDLAGVTFDESNFRRVVFRRCRMSGVVAADLVASDTRILDTRADEIWLRAAHFDQCELADCDLTGSDWYDARVSTSRLTGCRFDGAELSSLVLDDVALHGSTFAGASGLAGLRNAIIGTGQVVELGLPILAGLGIVVDNTALDDPAGADADDSG